MPTLSSVLTADPFSIAKATTNIDVLVVGSGTAGVTTVIELAQQGLSVVMLEAGPFVLPSHVGSTPFRSRSDITPQIHNLVRYRTAWSDREHYQEDVAPPLNNDAWSAVEGERLGDLARAVASEVEEDHRITITDPGRGDRRLVRSDNGGFDEVLAVARGFTGIGVIRAERRRHVVVPPIGRSGQAAIGRLDPIPAMISIHRPESAHHRDHPADAVGLDASLEFFEVSDAAGGCGVPPIGDRMDEHAIRRKSAPTGGIQKRDEMSQIAVDQSIAHQTQEVDLPAGRARPAEQMNCRGPLPIFCSVDAE